MNGNIDVDTGYYCFGEAKQERKLSRKEQESFIIIICAQCFYMSLLGGLLVKLKCMILLEHLETLTRGKKLHHIKYIIK